jgi:hypothetical protein
MPRKSSDVPHVIISLVIVGVKLLFIKRENFICLKIIGYFKSNRCIDIHVTTK